MARAPATSAERRWAQLVAEQEAAGATIRAFAKEKGVNARTLAWWRHQLRVRGIRLPEVVRFDELVVSEPRPAPRVLLRVERLGVQVLVEADTDLPRLREVLEALC